MNRAKQVSESVEIGILLAVAGGMMDAYSYILRDKVFANAQTGNILLFGISVYEKNMHTALRYLFPVLAFTMGIMAADIVRMKKKSFIHWRQVAVCIEAVILVGVGFIPMNMNLLANCLTSMACGIQVESFRKIHGNVMATTMCIGNLRSATQNICDYFKTGRIACFKKSMFYYGIIIFFVIGAVFENILIDYAGRYSICVSAVFLLIAFAVMFSDREKKIQ